MPTIVRSGGGGTDVSAANATTNQVLSGATFYSNASDDIQTGTMSNKGAVSQTAPYSGSAGYYSSISVTTTGTANNAHVLSGKTFMNANGTQTGAMANRGEVNTSVGIGGTYTNSAGYYSSIKVVGPTLSGNATADKVLKGYTFYSSNGTKQTGTIESKTLTGSVGVGGTYTNSTAGYYTSIKITGPSLSGNATAGDVLATKTFYASNGTLQTGTMVNKGSVTCTSLAAGSTCAPGAGYYSCISIKAASVSLSGNASEYDVINGYTFYNTSATTKRTGKFKYYLYSGDVIDERWQSATLDWTPYCYGAACDEGNKDHRIKMYRTGNTITWCFNGKGTYYGHVLALEGVD